MDILSVSPLMMYLSWTAPEDYGAVSTTLTIRAGADGSRPSDALCVQVPIVDDIVVEERESLRLRLTSLDESKIVVDEAEKILFIEDDDGMT